MGTALVRLLAGPPERRQKLPDGSWLVLESVTFGRHHQFDGRDWWEMLRGRQPAGFGNHGSSFSTSRDSLVFWLRRRAAPAQRVMRGVYGVVTDEHGCWFEPTTFDWGRVAGTGELGHLQQVGFDALPQRAGKLRLGFYDSYGHGPQASFVVTNPARAEGRPWPQAGAALPVTVQTGGTTFTLQRLTHRNVGLRRREAAVFHVAEKGRPSSAWQPLVITVVAADGSTAVSRIDGQHRLPDGSVRFSGLCRLEPTWKLQVEFVRTAPRLSERRLVEFLVRP